MSLQYLVNVAKCPTCNNMVPVGRIRPDTPRKCDACKRMTRKEKERTYQKEKYRKSHPKSCEICKSQITFTYGRRASICEDCKVKIKLRYLEQKCLYCQDPIPDKPQAKFCSHVCRMKTLYLIHGRKK